MSDTQQVFGVEAQDLEGGTLSNRELLRALLRKPQFDICLLLVLIFFLMAAVPRLFTSTDPRFCELAKSQQGRAPGHPFGFDIQGKDGQQTDGASPGHEHPIRAE